MIVMKFGGTSVGSARRMEEVIELVDKAAKGGDMPVVVLSAMSGVTNTLIAGAEKAVNRNLVGALTEVEAIAAKHREAIEALFGQSARAGEIGEDLEARLDELKVIYKGISYLGELTRRSLDAVSGVGEILSSRIVAELAQARGLNAQWLDARKFIVTDDAFGKANPLWSDLVPRTRQAVEELRGKGSIPITQGFIGATTSGAMTTLGRGGSDFTASIVGVALDADEIQIWTDVDGMMTADPRIIPDARVLPEVSFQEASELAYFGAKVLHPLTIKPAVEKNIPVRILNTLSPDKPGTLIRSRVDSQEVVRAVASKKAITAILISSPRMLMSHGFLARIFAVFDKYQTPIDLISTSEISVALTIDQVERLDHIRAELSEHGEIRVVEDVAIVTVVGGHFRHKSGIAARVFSCLRDINIVMISGGASDINLSFVVHVPDADQAVKNLHGEFFA